MAEAVGIRLSVPGDLGRVGTSAPRHLGTDIEGQADDAARSEGTTAP